MRNIFSQAKIDLLAGLLDQTSELSFLFQQKKTNSFTIDTLDLPPISNKLQNRIFDRITTQLADTLQSGKAF